MTQVTPRSCVGIPAEQPRIWKVFSIRHPIQIFVVVFFSLNEFSFPEGSFLLQLWVVWLGFFSEDAHLRLPVYCAAGLDIYVCSGADCVHPGRLPQCQSVDGLSEQQIRFYLHADHPFRWL